MAAVSASSAIGSFEIGISAIEAANLFDYRDTILSEYTSSPITSRLIDCFDDWINPNVDIDAFFNKIWNLETAEGIGLDIWGRIVGVDRVLKIAAGTFFGFAEPSDTAESPFNVAPFFSGGATTNNFALSDQAFRLLIMAKASANISDGSIPYINKILMTLFSDRGNAYVIDNADMTMIYRFEFFLTPVEASIVFTSGVLPKPAGVLATVVQGP